MQKGKPEADKKGRIARTGKLRSERGSGEWARGTRSGEFAKERTELDQGDGATEADFLHGMSSRHRAEARDFDRRRKVGKLFNAIIPGLPIDTEPPELFHEATSLAGALERLLGRYNIERSFWLDTLKEAWPRLVAAEVARDAQPGKFQDGILYIFVNSSVRLFELRRTQLRKIEAAVRAFEGGEQVRQVRLMVDSLPLETGGESAP